MEEKTKKIMRWFGIGFVCIALISIFTSMFIAKCVLGASSISQNSLFCYLCVDSDIRNFPLTGIDGQPEYGSNTEFIDGTSHFPPSNSVKFRSANLPNEIQARSKEYLESLGFGEIGGKSYKGASFTGYINEFKNNESLIIIEVQQTKNDSLNQVTVTKNFFTERYKL